MSHNQFGALPAITATIVALALGAGTVAVTGAFSSTHTDKSTAASAAPASDDTARTVSATSTPARQVITELLGAEAAWGAKVPAPFGCTTTPAPISAATTAASAHAYQAGMAATALEALTRCGRRTTVNGTLAISMTAPGGVVLAWARGDVLVTVSAPRRDDAAAAALDDRLVALLSPVCAALDTTTADAARNPASPSYAGYSEVETVTVEAIATPAPAAPSPAPSGSAEQTPTASQAPSAAVNLTDTLPAAAELTVPDMPSGVSGPPLPAAIPQPTPPTSPGEQIIATQITVAKPDTTGPGCGWAFTGQSAPVVDEDDLADQAASARSTAAVDLRTAQQQWSNEAAAYLSSAATYLASLEAWNAYVTEVNDVEASWNYQSEELTTYQHALAEHDQAVKDRDDFLRRQGEARTTYDAAVKACTSSTAPAGTPTPTPTLVPQDGTNTKPSGGLTPACNPKRPAILDEHPPSVPDAPLAPVLWTAP